MKTPSRSDKIEYIISCLNSLKYQISHTIKTSDKVNSHDVNNIHTYDESPYENYKDACMRLIHSFTLLPPKEKLQGLPTNSKSPNLGGFHDIEKNVIVKDYSAMAALLGCEILLRQKTQNCRSSIRLGFDLTQKLTNLTNGPNNRIIISCLKKPLMIPINYKSLESKLTTFLKCSSPKPFEQSISSVMNPNGILLCNLSLKEKLVQKIMHLIYKHNKKNIKENDFFDKASQTILMPMYKKLSSCENSNKKVEDTNCCIHRNSLSVTNDRQQSFKRRQMTPSDIYSLRGVGYSNENSIGLETSKVAAAAAASVVDSLCNRSSLSNNCYYSPHKKIIKSQKLCTRASNCNVNSKSIINTGYKHCKGTAAAVSAAGMAAGRHCDSTYGISLTPRIDAAYDCYEMNGRFQNTLGDGSGSLFMNKKDTTFSPMMPHEDVSVRRRLSQATNSTNYNCQQQKFLTTQQQQASQQHYEVQSIFQAANKPGCWFDKQDVVQHQNASNYYSNHQFTKNHQIYDKHHSNVQNLGVQRRREKHDEDEHDDSGSLQYDHIARQNQIDQSDQERFYKLVYDDRPHPFHHLYQNHQNHQLYQSSFKQLPRTEDMLHHLKRHPPPPQHQEQSHAVEQKYSQTAQHHFSPLPQSLYHQPPPSSLCQSQCVVQFRRTPHHQFPKDQSGFSPQSELMPLACEVPPRYSSQPLLSSESFQNLFLQDLYTTTNSTDTTDITNSTNTNSNITAANATSAAPGGAATLILTSSSNPKNIPTNLTTVTTTPTNNSFNSNMTNNIPNNVSTTTATANSLASSSVNSVSNIASIASIDSNLVSRRNSLSGSSECCLRKSPMESNRHLHTNGGADDSIGSTDHMNDHFTFVDHSSFVNLAASNPPLSSMHPFVGVSTYSMPAILNNQNVIYYSQLKPPKNLPGVSNHLHTTSPSSINPNHTTPHQAFATPSSHHTNDKHLPYSYNHPTLSSQFILNHPPPSQNKEPVHVPSTHSITQKHHQTKDQVLNYAIKAPDQQLSSADCTKSSGSNVAAAAATVTSAATFLSQIPSHQLSPLNMHADSIKPHMQRTSCNLNYLNRLSSNHHLYSQDHLKNSSNTFFHTNYLRQPTALENSHYFTKASCFQNLFDSY